MMEKFCRLSFTEKTSPCELILGWLFSNVSNHPLPDLCMDNIAKKCTGVQAHSSLVCVLGRGKCKETLSSNLITGFWQGLLCRTCLNIYLDLTCIFLCLTQIKNMYRPHIVIIKHSILHIGSGFFGWLSSQQILIWNRRKFRHHPQLKCPALCDVVNSRDFLNTVGDITNANVPHSFSRISWTLNSRHRFLPKPRLVISDIALCLQCVLSRSRIWIPNRTEADTWICGLVLRDSQNAKFQAWGETKAGTISLQLESFNCKQATTSKTPNSKMQPVLLLHSSNPYYWRYAGMKLKVKSRGSNLLGCL